MMLGNSTLVASRPFEIDKNQFGDKVLVDSTGRIIAGDPGQLSIDDYLQRAVLEKANTQPSISSGGVSTGHIVLLSLLGLLLLRGAIK
jgi:hypothetical protein